MSKGNEIDKEKSTLKGVRIRTLSIWIVIGTIAFSLLIGDGIINVMYRHHQLATMTQDYIEAEGAVLDMGAGSDYLTEQVRLYVVTKERRYANAYFTELNVTQRRERSLRKLETYLKEDNPDTVRLSREALELSDELVNVEVHAMRLAAESVGEDLKTLSPMIQEYQLPPEEEKLSNQEMSDLASDLVFGKQYQRMKHGIDEKLEDVSKLVISICDTHQKESQKTMKNALIRQIIYTILVVLLVILSYIMIAVLILRPIRIYINCIKNNNTLEIIGAYEFKYLAATYNNVYEMSMAQQDVLRKKAEHDVLTGLLNRQAFEQLKTQFRNISKPILLLLIDVDSFKSINDTYGHDIGDQALIKVAKVLENNFRWVDHIFRIGGDEFAVVMEKIKPDKAEIISHKLDQINWELQHPKDENFPKLSISGGIAFSDKGYNDDLFHQADKALYKTKEHGKCSYTFYESE